MKKTFVVLSRPLVAIIVLLCGAGCFAQGPTFKTPMPPIKTTPDLVPIKESSPFTFVVFGDSQGDKSEPLVLELIKDGVIASQKTEYPVALALSLGDLIVGEPPAGDIDPTKLTNTLTKARAKAAEFNIPVFNAPGNHEMDDKDPVVDGKPFPGKEMPTLEMRGVYENVIGQTYGSFDYGNSHFIVINTVDIPTRAATEAFIKSQAEYQKNFPKLHPGVPFHAQEFSYIGADQRAWLKADLDANSDKTHVFIAVHYPVYPKTGLGGWGLGSQIDQDSLNFMWELLKNRNNVSFVFASHQHLYYNHHDPGNVKTVQPFSAGEHTRFMVSGGAGAWLSASATDGGFFHYLKVHVDGNNVTVSIERTDTAK